MSGTRKNPRAPMMQQQHQPRYASLDEQMARMNMSMADPHTVVVDDLPMLGTSLVANFEARPVMGSVLAGILQQYFDRLRSQPELRASLPIDHPSLPAFLADLWHMLGKSITPIKPGKPIPQEDAVLEVLRFAASFLVISLRDTPSNQEHVLPHLFHLRIIINHLNSPALGKELKYYRSGAALLTVFDLCVLDNEQYTEQVWRDHLDPRWHGNLLALLMRSYDPMTRCVAYNHLNRCIVQPTKHRKRGESNNAGKRKEGLFRSKIGLEIVATLVDTMAGAIDRNELGFWNRDTPYDLARKPFYELWSSRHNNTFWLAGVDNRIPTARSRVTQHQRDIVKILDCDVEMSEKGSRLPPLETVVDELMRCTTMYREALKKEQPDVYEGVPEGITVMCALLEEAFTDRTDTSVQTLRNYFLAKSDTDNKGSVESLYEVLASANKFQRPYNFAPEAHVEDPKAQLDGLHYVRLAVVRLLTKMTLHSSAVRNRAWHCKGMDHVIPLTIPDPRNTYIREHAIWLVREILVQNKRLQFELNDRRLEDGVTSLIAAIRQRDTDGWPDVERNHEIHHPAMRRLLYPPEHGPVTPRPL